MANLNALTDYYRNFGQTGLKVSPVALGTVKIGRNQLVKNKVSDGFALPSDQEVDKLLNLALDLGINVIDTAPSYGESEAALGRVLGSKRQDFVISTKVGEEFARGISTYNFSAKSVRSSVERSLGQLKTDYLDSVLLHLPASDWDPLVNSPALEVLSRLKERGDILSYGASTKSVEGGLFAVEHCDSVMVSFNVHYRGEIEVIQKAAALNKGVFIIKALLQGHLDKVEVEDPLASCFKAAFDANDSAVVVMGTVNPSHLQENVSAALRSLP